jgi:hypothetical protein
MRPVCLRTGEARNADVWFSELAVIVPRRFDFGERRETMALPGTTLAQANSLASRRNLQVLRASSERSYRLLGADACIAYERRCRWTAMRCHCRRKRPLCVSTDMKLPILFAITAGVSTRRRPVLLVRRAPSIRLDMLPEIRNSR